MFFFLKIPKNEKIMFQTNESVSLFAINVLTKPISTF